jgi:hypothetical protein
VIGSQLVYDPHNDDVPGGRPHPFDRDYSYEGELLDDVHYVYDDDYEDEFYDDHDYAYPDEDAEYHYRGFDGYDAHPAYDSEGVIRPYEPDSDEPAHFWTRRRIFIVIIVLVMIVSLLAPTIYQIILSGGQNAYQFPSGPTATALPSI